jgi:hypothetical protein
VNRGRDSSSAAVSRRDPAAFQAALDQLAETPDADPFLLLFPKTRPKRT